ncbi:transcriptional regulator [Pelobium manganitolerans]|uniref:Transcriptional regulator n=1 Tax=Pelobium manganitolerans TaxID=1842495 RepID=A0A419S688_9SPHI|nr:response regulator [Pelobium manganitolerans]RKD16226.1 transcriptional regulator [Pelobium manganitolerans]
MKQTILIIEDNTDIRESTAEILELAGYHTITAENGKLGVELAQKQLPALIICDIMMPELDGYGVLYLLSKQPETAVIPFIFLTAKTERIDMRKGMEMGADDYLTKPFDDMELLNAIEGRLAKQQKHQDFYSQGLRKLEDFSESVNDFEGLKRLLASKKVRSLKKGQLLYFDGDTSQGIYLVLTGKVKISKITEDGRELVTAIHSADQYFGIYDALVSRTHTENAEAVEESTVCLLYKEQLDDILQRNANLAMQFIHLLSETVHEKEEQLIQMAYHSVRKRLAETLLRVSEINGSETFKISRNDLAAMAGMATETVSRTLSDFKEEHLLDKKGAEISLLSVEKLRKMKN